MPTTVAEVDAALPAARQDLRDALAAGQDAAPEFDELVRLNALRAWYSPTNAAHTDRPSRRPARAPESQGASSHPRPNPITGSWPAIDSGTSRPSRRHVRPHPLLA